MNTEEIYQLYSKNYLVDTDTRKIRKNTIYFALKGTNFNGNTFAKEALNKGALYSIVDEKKYVTSNRIIFVDDVLKSLQALAKFHRKQLSIPIIGLTGSNGKTTTKELINAILSKKYNTTATLGNYNNHIGVPLTLLSMTPKTEIGIVEMGANHHKEIEFLCNISNPDYGYITNFGKAHLEGFGSIKGVIEAKSELYKYIKETNKTVFINPKDPIQVEKTKEMNFIPFDNTIQFINSDPFVRLSFQGNKILSNLIGDYNYNNISAAITIGNHLKVVVTDIKSAIEEYIPTNNRSQIVKTTKGNTLILDAYNANPTSIKAALDSFKMNHYKNDIIILGDMFELGTESAKEHQFITNYCIELGFKNVLLVGENFYNTNNSFLKFKSYLELANHIHNTTIEKRQILIKGSRGMTLERLTEIL